MTLTKAQVQKTAIQVVESMQGVIGQLNKDLAAGEKENERLEARIVELLEKVAALQQIAADLNQENVGLKQRIAQLESGRKQTVYPWKKGQGNER